MYLSSHFGTQIAAVFLLNLMICTSRSAEFHPVDQRSATPTSTHHENNASSMTRPSVLKRLPRFRSLHTASTDPYNAFLSQYPVPRSPSSDSKPDSPIYGKSIALKDNICTNDALPTTCASRTLESTSLEPNPLIPMPPVIPAVFCLLRWDVGRGTWFMVDYFSPFDATVVTLLRDAGAVITGKTNMDEFAMGSTSTNNLVSVVNPHRGKMGEELSAGGSSGGSAAAVAAGLAWGYYLLLSIYSHILSLLFLFCSLGCLFFGVQWMLLNGCCGWCSW